VADAELKLNDILAIDRTRLAAERSLMAWVRTSLSMISFGFTIYKVLETLQEQSKLHIARPDAPRNLGLVLVGIGTFALVVACIQHRQYVTSLKPTGAGKPLDLTFLVAVLITLLGFLLFGSMILRSGPLG
jgi:putative membrane protein